MKTVELLGNTGNKVLKSRARDIIEEFEVLKEEDKIIGIGCGWGWTLSSFTIQFWIKFI